MFRRDFLNMAAAGGAFAAAGLPMATQAQGAEAAAALVSAAQLGGDVTYVVADLRSGLVLEERGGATPMAPASTAKVITSLYALETLGPGFRFTTRLVATGPVSGGLIQGDLILVGGGDPTLGTDDLDDLAADLVKAGVRGVTGRFLIWAGALPYAAEIANDQPIHVGYNPAISGLILNFNRVHFEWRRAGAGYEVGMDARGARVQPKAYTADASVANRKAPLFTYERQGGKEHWSVAAGSLGKAGSRWLPVRDPAAYAGDVFQTLARARGVPLPAPQTLGVAPGGTVIASHASAPLDIILRDMMKYSTNVTAEAVGMTTSAYRKVDPSRGASGEAMAGWLKARAGTGNLKFSDHSGLGADTRIAAMDMVRALRLLGPKAGLRSLMKGYDLRDDTGRKLQTQPLDVDAKTGTLNFVSTLAGYMTAPDGTELVFAIFTGDLARRARFARDEMPAGTIDWVKRSKILQSQLLMRWARLYGS